MARGTDLTVDSGKEGELVVEFEVVRNSVGFGAFLKFMMGRVCVSSKRIGERRGFGSFCGLTHLEW